jgi:hypothetical protein
MPRWVYLNSPSISLPHSYFPQLREGLPFYAADARGDTLFPDHLLTQVRAALARIVPTVRLTHTSDSAETIGQLPAHP